MTEGLKRSTERLAEIRPQAVPTAARPDDIKISLQGDLEAVLGRILAASGCRRRACSDRYRMQTAPVSRSSRLAEKGQTCELTVQDSVGVARTGPFLVREDVAADRLLLLLDQVDVGEHAVGLEALRKLGCGAQWERGGESAPSDQIVPHTA